MAFIGPAAEDWDDKIIELIETEIKYEGYISKAMDQVAKMKRMEEKRIPANIDWDDIDSIATEARQKFKLINPETIGQASRISGVNPADISILMVYLGADTNRYNKYIIHWRMVLLLKNQKTIRYLGITENQKQSQDLYTE